MILKTTTNTGSSRTCSDEDRFHIDRLQRELEQCHEDDREAKGRILQAVAVMVAVLAISYALVVAVGPADDAAIAMQATLAICLILTAAAEIACLCYIVSIGVVQIVRSLYMGEVERLLCKYDSVPDRDGGSAMGWLEICGAVNTLNPRQIYHRISAIHFTSTLGAMFGVTVVCLAFLLLFGFSLGNHGNLVFLAALVIIPFFVFMLWVLYSVAFRSDGLLSEVRKVVRDSRTSELYEPLTSKSALKILGRVYHIKHERKSNNANIKWFIRYAVFPRLQDEPKGLFMLAGYVIAYGWFVVRLKRFPNLLELVFQLIYLWFVLDFLVFQVRYQINDIRGRDEDRENPAKWRRHRLHSLLGDKDAPVRMSALVAGYRSLIALACMIANYLHMGIPIALSTLVIALLAIIYECLRTAESKCYQNWRFVHSFSLQAMRASQGAEYRSIVRPVLMKAVMSLGYAARFFYGVICCVFCLQGQVRFSNPSTLLPSICDALHLFATIVDDVGGIAAAIILFGYAVASMIWSLEGASVIQQNSEGRYPKAHTVASAKRLGPLVWETRPIARARSLKYPWVSCMFLAVVLLVFISLTRAVQTDALTFCEVGACSLLLLSWYASLSVEGAFASVLRAARLLVAILYCSLMCELVPVVFGAFDCSPCVYLAFASLLVGFAMLAAYGFLVRSSYAMLNRFPSYQFERAFGAGKRFIGTLFDISNR